ncbi:unnamed protein product [Eruca vesicaria subsp. sativa]|uniref:Uncharacterized protein n=1 Tax=Eruca vesicaria subsp. sativa TaxID=29727 RepID=A0ABC8K9I3_ERUVS|nr:unnamed protein product [Eruca vesicaria subsp. sativa]
MYSLILHGRRSVELHRCHNPMILVYLLQNASPFSNSFSSAIAADVIFLQEESISNKVSFEEKGKPDSVLGLFRSHGFTDSHISSIVTDYPRLLIADAERSLSPKLMFLKSRGVSSSELTEILSKVPKILGVKKEKAFLRYYDFVKEVIEADKSSNYKKLRRSSLPQGNVKFKESLKKVVELGFDPTTSKFVKALFTVQKFSSKAIEEKVIFCKNQGFDVWAMFKKFPTFLNSSGKKINQTIETLKKFGLQDEEILSLFDKCPQCISYSEQKMDKAIETLLCLGFSKADLTVILKRRPQCIGLSAESVKKKTEFLVKEMNWPLKAVASFPEVLGLSMEKRIVPRCNVIKALISKGLIKSEQLPPLASALVCTDQDFFKRYVRKHDDDVAELMAIFTGETKTNKKITC